jgi:hypothetical protein
MLSLLGRIGRVNRSFRVFASFRLPKPVDFRYHRSMTTRAFLAGLLAGVAMFIWSSIAHMALPLGKTGFSVLPDEKAVQDALHSNLADKEGLYLFPGPRPDEKQDEAMKRMQAELATNPSGLLLYHPPGRAPAFGRRLGVEFGVEILEGLLAVYLLSRTRLSSFGGRVGFILVAGILAAVATNVSYWNWYDFPGAYIGAYMLTQVIGFLCAGIVAALVLGKSPAAA